MFCRNPISHSHLVALAERLSTSEVAAFRAIQEEQEEALRSLQKKIKKLQSDMQEVTLFLSPILLIPLLWLMLPPVTVDCHC